MAAIAPYRIGVAGREFRLGPPHGLDSSIQSGRRSYCIETDRIVRLAPPHKTGRNSMDFLIALEETSLSIWVRESTSLWAYPTILTLHTFGMAWLGGVNAAIDLRVLGFAPNMSLSQLARFFPIMWLGFWLNALSGIPLMIADATTKFTSPVLWIKLVFVAAAVVNLRLLLTRTLRNRAMDNGAALPTMARVLAATSLLFWIGAITAGRLMAYLGPVTGFDF